MTKTNQLFKRIGYVVAAFAVAVVPFLYAGQASAAQITNRKVTIGSSVASASTTYAFSFTVPSATAIKSAEFVACTTASGACTTPSGFSQSASTLTGQPTGFGAASGWTVSTATAGSLRLANGANATAPGGTSTVSFSGVVNPSATNSTFFLRMTTYSVVGYTTPIDTGTVAASTAGAITVNATVDEALTFTLSSATISLGTLTSGATGSNGTVTMTASTNANSGYAISYSAPNSLRSGSNDIAAYTNGTSAPGTEGFGFNLMANSTPSVGTGVTGAGSATAQAGYNTANQYSFSPAGTTIASSTGPSNTNVFTISYVANISPVTPAGAYTTVVNYVATPNF